MPLASPEKPWETKYRAHQVTVVLETAALRILEARFAPGDEVPLHTHSHIVDHFWVVDGVLEIETASPAQRVTLGAGGYFAVPPGCAHKVRNTGSGLCHFVSVQGTGRYDFNLLRNADERVPD
jgi:quercetin dioxygenase-like cupin family protein